MYPPRLFGTGQDHPPQGSISQRASRDISAGGQVAEWLKAHAWNACIGETLSRVRIPLCPPFQTHILDVFVCREVWCALFARGL